MRQQGIAVVVVADGADAAAVGDKRETCVAHGGQRLAVFVFLGQRRRLLVGGQVPHRRWLAAGSVGVRVGVGCVWWWCLAELVVDVVVVGVCR